MRNRKNQPRGIDLWAWKGVSKEFERILLTHFPDDGPAEPTEEYWLHVDSHGVEHRYDNQPDDVKTMHVIVEGAYETTSIKTVKSERGVRFILPKPHGRGWKLLDDSSDNWTSYRRRARRAGAA